MAISDTAVLSIAAPVDIVHLGRSMLSNASAHHTAQQEIPTGLSALGMTVGWTCALAKVICLEMAFANAQPIIPSLGGRWPNASEAG